MSIDLLQEKIRKLKCPIILDLSMKWEQIPECFRQEEDLLQSYAAYCRALMEGLKNTVAGVRFSFDRFALLDGLQTLSALLQEARALGYYVIVDAPGVSSVWAAECAAALLESDSRYPCHCVIADPYIGSDAIKAFVPVCKEGKAVFFAVRRPNKSAVELQDLITGSRLVHMAAADLVNRYGESLCGKFGYSGFGALTAATNAGAVRELRSKYSRMFLLVDGLDYPGGNGKNCSYGFDRLGHGCAVSVGAAISAAWAEEYAAGEDPVALAVSAAQRIRNNFTRYVTSL